MIMDNHQTDPLDRWFRFTRAPKGWVPPSVSYELLSESPEKIENWLTRHTTTESTGTQIVSLTSYNDVFIEKGVTFQITPDMDQLAKEKIEGRGKMSFQYVSKHRYEIGLTKYGNILFGKTARVTDVVAAKEDFPILMKQTVKEELDDWLPIDGRYEEIEVSDGYDAGQLVNERMQAMMEDEMEYLFDDKGYLFSEDGKSFQKFCEMCDHAPCVWTANLELMTRTDNSNKAIDADPNTRREKLHRGMSSYINRDVRVGEIKFKLPECVVTGALTLIPNSKDS
jgi:hypothetical protein